MDARHEVVRQQVTPDPTRWDRNAFGISVWMRPEDADLATRLRAAQARLDLPDLSVTARWLIGLVSLDILPWSPLEAGRHTGEFSRQTILKRQAHEAARASCQARLSKEHREQRQVSSVLTPALYAVVAFRRSLRRRMSKSGAAREVFEHGLEMLAAGGPEVDGFLSAHMSAFAEEVSP
jgi:hypothetical protein